MNYINPLAVISAVVIGAVIPQAISDQFNNYMYGVKATPSTLALYSMAANTIALTSSIALFTTLDPLTTLKISVVSGPYDPTSLATIASTVAIPLATTMAIPLVSLTIGRIAAKCITDKTTTQPITWNHVVGLTKSEICNGLALMVGVGLVGVGYYLGSEPGNCRA